MCKKFFVLFFVFSVLNGSEIVSVKLGKERLEPLFERNLHIVCELENYAIILFDGDYKALKGLDYKIIEKKSDERYYLVKVLEDIDLSRYGRILLQDGDIFLFASAEGRMLELKKHRVFFKYLTFEPILKRDITFYREFQYNLTIQEIVDRVNPDSVLYFVRRLQDFRSRFSTYDSTFYAALWIGQKFYEYGCDTVIFQYHTAGHAPNVIGIKYGTVYPSNHYVIICGHFDAYSNQIPTFVPGADDNASGTAGALECARVMKDYRFEYTIKFIAFSGEEFGLYGSEYYAQNASSKNDTIIGVINADMIGYAYPYPESIDVITRTEYPNCEPLADYFIECAENYTDLLTLKYYNNWAYWSDHAPFWDYGYHSICLIEDEDVPNHYYHTIGDTIGGGYKDNLFAKEVIKGEVATVASLASPSYSPNSPFSPFILSPFDCARIPDLRPKFTFYSLDPQDDSLIYQILIDETQKYNSGDTVNVIFPYNLDYNKTYYWKVRCKDPDGSNFWSLYSEIKSFNISDSIPEMSCSFFMSCSIQFLKSDINGLRISGNQVILDDYFYIYDTLFYEDFESGIPADWTINDGNGDNIKWQTGTISSLLYFIPPSYGTKYAYYNDRVAGNNVLNTAEEITSPPIYIPSDLSKIYVSYGYGIRINQSGEKMQFKYRRRTTSWLSWIINHTHYENSNGSRVFEINLSTTPMESLQLRWTYTDQQSSNHYGYACALDNPLVYTIHQVPNNSGEMITKIIDFDELKNIYDRDFWGDIITSKSSQLDSVGIQVEYFNGSSWSLIPDQYLQGNSEGIFLNNVIDTISLMDVPPEYYKKIRVKVLFKRYSEKSPSSPALLSLEVGNLWRYLGIYEGNEKPFILIKNILSDKIELRWGLMKEKKVKIDLYDITGRKVLRLFDGKINPNQKILEFNLDGKISNGIYFISIDVDKERYVKKMILLK